MSADAVAHAISARDKALAFGRAHAVECARELLAKRDTGTLPKGRVHEMASMLTNLPDSDRVMIAEIMLTKVMLEIVAGVGAVPTSTDDGDAP